MGPSFRPAGDPTSLGDDLHARLRALFPLCRSITGEGLRQTLRNVAEDLPLRIHEVPSGMPVLDWTVPDEWTIREAWIETVDGRRLVDFARNNLHVVGYSRAVDRLVSRSELRRHVHTLPAQPALVPYRTGYHADDWGFCLADRLWSTMTDDLYRVRIDSTCAPGSLSYGEFSVPGQTSEEVLLSIHCCHPSLANDNLSGLVVALEAGRRALARQARGERRRRGLRILFLPATIGSITWLARNPDASARVVAGLVLACLGDPGGFHYKRSRRGAAQVDRVVARVLPDLGHPLVELPFTPMGYDERQYGSPGFDLPVGCLMRSPNGTFPEYHTSADDPDFVRPACLAESAEVLWAVLEALDAERHPLRVDGRGEPQLGRRGLYAAIGGRHGEGGTSQAALLWLLNLADGAHDLAAIAERAGLPFAQIRAAADIAAAAGLLRDRDLALPHEELVR